MFRLIMRFKILVIFMLFTSLAYAEKLPEIRGLDRAFSVKENDGSPILYDCRMLSVDNGTLTDNADGSATFSIAGFADNVYLKLDQTTPQTVINGIPTMQEGLTIGDSSTYLTFDEVTAPNSLLTNTYNQITSYSNSGTENPIYFPNGIFIENSPTTYYDIVGDGSILATFNIADLVTLSADPSGGGFYANAAMYVLANRTGTIDDYAASQVDVSSVHYFKLDNDATYSGSNDLGIFNVALSSQLDLHPTINDATSDYLILGYAQQATLIDTMPAETVNSLGVLLAGLDIQVETISSNRTENAFINGIRLANWDIRASDEASTYAIYDETGYDWLISSTDTYIQLNDSNSKIGATDANHLDLIATETIDMHAGADANKYATFGKLTNGGSVYYTAGTYPEIKVYNDDTTRPDMLYLDGSLAIEDTLSRVPADNFLEYGAWTKHEHTGSWTGSPADKTALFGGIRIESYRSGIITDYGTGCKDITHGEYYMINNTASYQGTSDGAYIVNYGIMGDCLSEHFYNSSGHSITNINAGLVANVETDTTESQGTMDTYNVCFLGVLETKDMDISNGSVLNAGLALGSLDGTTPPAWNIKAGQESNTFGIWDSTAYDWKLSSLDKYIQFYDSSIKIGADDDGHLDLMADVSIDLNLVTTSISYTESDVGGLGDVPFLVGTAEAGFPAANILGLGDYVWVGNTGGESEIFFGNTSNYILYDGTDMEIASVGDLYVVADGGDIDMTGDISITGTLSVSDTSYPLTHFIRTTADTTGGLSLNAYDAVSTGDMGDTFGPFLTFRIADDGVGATTIGSIGARRYTADNTGEIVLAPRNSGTAEAGLAIRAGYEINFGGGTSTTNVLKMKWDCNTAIGIMEWIANSDYFKFHDDIILDVAENLYFRDTDIHINSADDGHLDLFADTSIDLNPHASRSISVTDYTFSITSDNYPALAPTSDGVLGDVLFVDGGFIATDTRVTADMLDLGGFYLGIGSSFIYSYTADVSSTDGFAIFYNENLTGTRSGTVSSYSGTYGESFINLQSDYINEATYSGGSAIIYNVSVNAAVENDITLNNASSDFTIANEGISIGLISSETITNANSYTITNTCLTGTIDTSDSDGDANTVNKIIDIGSITTSSTHNASIYDNTGNNWYLKADNAALRFGDGNTSSGIENDGDVEIFYSGTNWDYDIRIATTAIRFNPSQLDTDFEVYGDTGLNFKVDAGTGAANIGDGGTTNYSKFDSSGVLTFYGSAQRGFKIRPALDLTSTLAGGTPTEVTRGANKGYSMPIWSTPSNQNEELYFRLQIPQRWDGTTDPQVGVYVSLGNGVEDVGDKFQFQLSWASSNCGGSDTVSTTVSSVTSEQTVITGGTAAYTGYCIWFTLDTDDANNPLASGNMLTARLRRVAATANEVTNEPVVWDWTTSWKQDKVGGTWSVEENVS